MFTKNFVVRYFIFFWLLRILLRRQLQHILCFTESRWLRLQFQALSSNAKSTDVAQSERERADGHELPGFFPS